jgi:hypothetical protein
MLKMRRPVGRLVEFLTLAILTAGCGGPKMSNVEGVITLDGTPLPNVQVVFVPEPGGPEGVGNAEGKSDSAGHFELRSSGGTLDGAAVGKYRVILTDLAAISDLTATAPPGAGEPAAPAGPRSAKARRFPVSYGDVQQTPLKGVEVKPGDQKLNFDVKAKGQ